MSKQHTPEQQAIINAADSSNASLLIEARAGTGKTTTLMDLLPSLSSSTAIMAFNRSIADELKARVVALPFSVQLGVELGTVHSFGLKAFTKGSGRRPKVSGGKISFIIKDHLAKLPKSEQDYWRPVTYLIKQIVGGAKNAGFGIMSAAEPFPRFEDDGAWWDMLSHFNWDLELENAGVDPEKAAALAKHILDLSNRQLSNIDFDDMIYLPLLLNHHIPQFHNVLIDEAQDISPTRREFAFRMLSHGGRIIAVGDEYQAIYGFTGADANSLSAIKRRASAESYPLTICWRCDDAIISAAQEYVPDIQARPGATAGEVSEVSLPTLAAFFDGTLPSDKTPDEALIPRVGDAILCRLNKPNVSMALTLIKSGIRARIEGRDLGSKLLSHVKASNPLYHTAHLSELIINLEDYGRNQQAALTRLERHASAAYLQDEIDCAILLMERCLANGHESFDALEYLISDLFADDIPPSGVVTLSSIHKAKGREWPRVFLLGKSDYQPFHRATQPWEKQQERNLIYVAYTRAERHLIHITGVQSHLDKAKSAKADA